MNKKLLKELNNQIINCRKCPLYKTAQKSVPGDGNPDAKIVFIGEAPGRREDETGLPFVGRAGKLLDQLLDSINLNRKSVFITSVIKHHPPKNRQPKPLEIKQCSRFLDIQLSIIKPQIIVTLGRFAMEYFLINEKISQIHGTIQLITKDKQDYKIFPVYHPAAGLRSIRNKNKLFEDFKKLEKVIHYAI